MCVSLNLNNSPCYLLTSDTTTFPSKDQEMVTVEKVFLDNVASLALLMEAAKKGDKETISALIDSKVDLNTQDDVGATALGWAVLNSHEEIVTLLLNNSVNVDLPNIIGQTPLMLGTNVKIVTSLLAAGADPNTQCIRRETALMSAVGKGLKDIVEILIANKAKINIQNSHGWTPCTAAAMLGRPDIEKLMKDTLDPTEVQSHKEALRSISLAHCTNLGGILQVETGR